MKKIFYISMAVLMAAAVLPSCNKKLKEDIAALDKSVEDLKTQNTAIEGQILTTSTNINPYDAALETSNPITWTIKCEDYNPHLITFNKTYTAKLLLGAKRFNQYIRNIGGGIWRVFIYKSEDYDWDDTAFLDLYYNTTTNKFSTVNTSFAYCEHYEEYDGGTQFDFYASTPNTGHLFAPTKFDINTTTGDVDIAINWEIPSGGTFNGFESGTIAFKGNCFIFPN